MEERTRHVDGVRMRWIEHGSGVPVVLVHGIPTSPALWRHVMPLVPDARVLAWEMVGFGASIPEGRKRSISVARQAGYLRAWMKSLELGPSILVGHDLGGGVVQIAALDDPSLCAGLVLINAVGYDSWPIPSVKAMRAAGWLVSRLPDRALRAVLGVFLLRGHDDRRIAGESLDVHLRPYLDHDGAAALVRQMKALETRDTLDVVPSLPELRRVPARVVWGAADPFQKIRYGERLASDLDCPIDRIESGKHFVPEDHPDRVALAIAQVAEAAERESHGARPTPIRGGG